MKYISLLFTLLFITFLLSAQTNKVNITGKVYDIETGEPIIGATIRERDTNSGTMSSIDGSYSLQCYRYAHLEISFLGYKAIEWEMKDSDLDNNYIYNQRDEVEFSAYKDFYLKQDKEKCSLMKHSISAYSTFNSNIGMAFSYKYSFYDLCLSSTHYAYFPYVHFYERLSFGITYARPDFKDNALLFTQLYWRYDLPFYVRSKYRLSIFVGAGYYWTISNDVKLRKGNIAFSGEARVWRQNMFHDLFTFDVVCGYNCFIKRKKDNHFFLGIVIYPFTTMR